MSADPLPWLFYSMILPVNYIPDASSPRIVIAVCNAVLMCPRSWDNDDGAVAVVAIEWDVKDLRLAPRSRYSTALGYVVWLTSCQLGGA